MSSYIQPGNNTFSGVQNFLQVGYLQSTIIKSNVIDSVNMNSVSNPRVASIIKATLPSSFYNAPFAGGSAATPIVMLNPFGNPIPLSTSVNDFLGGIQVIVNNFGPNTGGSLANPAYLYIGTSSILGAGTISFTTIGANQVPLVGGQIEINASAGLATTSNYLSFENTAGVSTAGGTGPTATATPSIAGFSKGILYCTATTPNNYLCCYLTAPATTSTLNATGGLTVYLTRISSIPTF